MFLPLILAATLSTNVTSVTRVYDRSEAARLVPLLTQVLKYPTYAGNDAAIAEQQQWLLKTAKEMGFVARDAGKVTEIDLPGPEGAPVLGLMVHGDVQPVNAEAWSFPPFAAKVEKGYVYGRGSADDKGPLVQALLAMHALKLSGVARTHTIRLLVGSDEESGSTDVTEYLKSHTAPDYTLVIDSNFPVVVGEKAWTAVTVTEPIAGRDLAQPLSVTDLSAGLATSIVPDEASITLRSTGGAVDWQAFQRGLESFAMPDGTHMTAKRDGDTLRVAVHGRSAHAGVNLEGGRNALVALARLMEGRLPAGGADDLLTFARIAGTDFYGTGLGITASDPLWGRDAVNVATISPAAGEPSNRTLTINVRRVPPTTGPLFQKEMEAFVQAFNSAHGSALVPGGFYGDEPLIFDPNAKLVKRLLADYDAAMGGKTKPAISGGGTYAKRLPNSIAFGMWFTDKPYPGHDVDEKNPIADLQKGAHVLIRAMVDLATGPKIEDPFKP